MRGQDTRRLLLCGLIGLAGCTGGDWRAEAIANAEDKMRIEVNDPTATFKGVQLTGNNSTGQTCGIVRAKVGTGWKNVRFIVFIDGDTTLVEAGLGRTPTSKKDFDFQWQYDCLNEGYKS